MANIEKKNTETKMICMKKSCNFG